MTRNRILYLVLVILLAGIAAVSGAAVGGVVVYRTMSQLMPTSQVASAPVVKAIQANTSTSPVHQRRLSLSIPPTLRRPSRRP